MQTELPIAKLFKIALLTTPFFGLFGAAPGFAFTDIDVSKILQQFLVASGITFFLWLINILLLRISFKIGWLQKKGLRFLISVIVIAIIMFIIFLLVAKYPPDSHLPAKVDFPMPKFSGRMLILPFGQILSINIIIFILIELLVLREIKNKINTENQQLKLVNLEARNNQLKEQLHPHFLFNSLSTLRSLINRSPQQAEEYLERLSELLRFSTNNSKNAFVNVQEEIELCTNYLNMQKVRFGEALDFIIDLPTDKNFNGNVPIYSIQQLVENAIKHNVITREQPLHIKISYDVDTSRISVTNSLQPKQIMPVSTGTGLANLSERYRLSGSDDILIQKKDGYFSVSIKIIPNGSSNN
jgi:two-component system, LytTR family, sensor kinase